MISISFSSCLLTLFWSSIMILLFSFLLKCELAKHNIGLSFLLFFSFLTVIRLMTPFEFRYTIALISTKVLPFIQYLLFYPVFHGRLYVYQLLLTGWIAGLLRNILITGKRYYHFQKFLKASFLPLSEETAHYADILKKIHCPQYMIDSCRFVRSHIVTTPAVTGWLKPVILLPELDFTDQELEFIFMHEWTHFRHLDLFWKSFLGILHMTFWWNPFIVLLLHKAEEAIELKVDKAATRNLTYYQKIEYLECIIKIQKHQMSLTHPSPFTFAFSDKDYSALSARAKYLINATSTKTSRFAIISSIIFLVMSTLFTIKPDCQNTATKRFQRNENIVFHEIRVKELLY